MKGFTSIQIKASLLLTVFAINTVVGFACSVGVDMGFNTKHHGKEEAGEIHIHKDGKKHIHPKKADKILSRHDKKEAGEVHIHKDGKKHIHPKKADKGSNSQDKEEVGEVHVHKDGKKHIHPKKSDSHTASQSKENCCTDDVIKLSQEDKAVASFLKLSNPVFLTAFTIFYNDLLPNFLSQRTVSNKYFVLGHHPPIADVRVAIQSFQI